MDFEVTVQAGLRRPYENVPAGSIRPFLSLSGKAGAAGNAPVFRIPAVGNHQNLRYKTGISCFGRSQILIFAGQYAILLISAAEA